MNPELEELLQPIAGADPCGDDLSFDSNMGLLEQQIMQGASLESSEEVDWKEVRRDTLKLLNQSRDLNLFLYLTVANLRLDGLGGFRDGLQLLQGACDNFWDDLYPKIDDEDLDEDEDDESLNPRMNILNNLAAPYKSFGDPYAVIECLRESPLAAPDSRAKGFSYADILRAESPDEADVDDDDDVQGPSIDVVRGYFNRAEVEQLDAVEAILGDCLAAVRGMVSSIEAAVARRAEELDRSVTNALSLGNLIAELEAVQAKFLAYRQKTGGASASVESPEAEATAGAMVGAPAAAPAVAAGPSGAIRNADDVRTVFDKVIDYYTENEPSSPVPLLLRRVRKLVDADFMDIVANLNKDAEYEFRRVFDLTD